MERFGTIGATNLRLMKMGEVIALFPWEKPAPTKWGYPKTLKLAEIDVDPSWNSRSGDLDVGKLKDSIEEIGLIEPIVVTRRDSRYQLVAGFRRFEAARQLGWEEIPAVVIEADAERARIFNLAENLGRKNLRLYDTMRAIYDLSEKKGIKSVKIARDTGIKQARVEMMARIWPRLSPTIKDKWSRVTDASWEPSLHQLTEWSSLSWSEQNREWRNWANDEDPDEPEDDEEDNYPKGKRHVRGRRKASVVRAMASALYEEKTKEGTLQARALQWALGERTTL